jgi:hypothetical protein
LSEPDSASARAPRRTARWPLLLALLAAAGVLALAGVPGRERTAGDGSGALRHGWAEERAREAGWLRGADGTLAPADAVEAPSAPR